MSIVPAKPRHSIDPHLVTVWRYSERIKLLDAVDLHVKEVMTVLLTDTLCPRIGLPVMSASVERFSTVVGQRDDQTGQEAGDIPASCLRLSCSEQD